MLAGDTMPIEDNVCFQLCGRTRTCPIAICSLRGTWVQLQAAWWNSMKNIRRPLICVCRWCWPWRHLCERLVLQPNTSSRSCWAGWRWVSTLTASHQFPDPWILPRQLHQLFLETAGIFSVRAISYSAQMKADLRMWGGSKCWGRKQSNSPPRQKKEKKKNSEKGKFKVLRTHASREVFTVEHWPHP